MEGTKKRVSSLSVLRDCCNHLISVKTSPKVIKVVRGVNCLPVQIKPWINNCVVLRACYHHSNTQIICSRSPIRDEVVMIRKITMFIFEVSSNTYLKHFGDRWSMWTAWCFLLKLPHENVCWQDIANFFRKQTLVSFNRKLHVVHTEDILKY